MKNGYATYTAFEEFGATGDSTQTGFDLGNPAHINSRRQMVCLHGGGGSYLQYAPIESAFSGAPVVGHLAACGIVARTIDAGGPWEWGNDHSMSVIDDAVDFYGQGSPVDLFAYSMGGLEAINYAYRFPSKVRALILNAPAIDLDAFEANPTFQANIRLAYGVTNHANYMTAANGHRPMELAATITTPTRIINASNDATVAPSTVTDFFNALGSPDKQHYIAPSGGHTAFWEYWDLTQLQHWLLNL